MSMPCPLDPAAVFTALMEASDICQQAAQQCRNQGQPEAEVTLLRASKHIHDQAKDWWAMKHPGDLGQP